MVVNLFQTELFKNLCKSFLALELMTCQQVIGTYLLQ